LIVKSDGFDRKGIRGSAKAEEYSAQLTLLCFRCLQDIAEIAGMQCALQLAGQVLRLSKSRK
jgi:hypothetical protein